MPVSRPEAHLAVRRSALASVLFALIRPRDAKAAAVDADVLTLTLLFGSKEIPFQEIETAEIAGGWFWGGVRIHCASGKEAVSGLSRREALALFDALESARIDWWHRVLDARVGTLSSVHARVSQLVDPPRYMSRSVFSDLERDAKDAVGQLPSRWPDNLSGSEEIQMLKAIQNFLKDSEGYRARANNTFVVNELVRSRGFFDRIEARPLTDEQRRAVAVDEDRNLVVAAAGSGKTSVIVAKAGWLLRKGYRRPSELLLLAFAKDARTEMEERVRRRLGEEAARGITVRTFHSLGMSIIGEAEGKRPTMAKVAEDDKSLFDLLKRIVADLLANREFSQVLLNWFQDRVAPYKSQHEFQGWGEYWDYIRRHEIRSLKGEKVRSFEECEIANFLYLNGVPYEYERAYEHDTATPEKRQYQPDFYLPEAGIYIEHFALNAAGDIPPFINGKEYRRSMDWKRQLHAQHKTTLIETYSHECAAGQLTEKLATKLIAHSVTLSPIRPDKVFAILEEQGRIDPFTRLVAIFLEHYKGAQLSFEEVVRGAASASDAPRGESVPLRVSTDLRALPGNALPIGTDRLPRHDQQGDGTCGGRELPQPVWLHPGRRVSGHIAWKSAAAEGAAGPVDYRPTVRCGRRLAGHIPFRRIRYYHHARIRRALWRQRARRPGDDLPMLRSHRRGRNQIRPEKPGADTQEGPFNAAMERTECACRSSRKGDLSVEGDAQPDCCRRWPV